MSWYGKAFYFVEVPRRFVVTIWGLVAASTIAPEPWMMWLTVAACLAFDLLVTRRAPDLRLTKEDIQAKLALGAEPVFLTWREVLTRLGFLALGGAVLAGIAWYWFTNGQQPVLASQLGMAGTVMTALAYISARGIPLRTKRTLNENETPFLMPGCDARGR